MENFSWAMLWQRPSGVCGNVGGGPTLGHIYKENNCVSEAAFPSHLYLVFITAEVTAALAHFE